MWISKPEFESRHQSKDSSQTTSHANFSFFAYSTPERRCGSLTRPCTSLHQPPPTCCRAPNGQFAEAALIMRICAPLVLRAAAQKWRIHSASFPCAEFFRDRFCFCSFRSAASSQSPAPVAAAVNRSSRCLSQNGV